jgi:hypothetical protein
MGDEVLDSRKDLPLHLRFVGSIFVLHVLMEAIEATGLTAELGPGPTPDVSVVVHTHRLVDGVTRLRGVLEQWRAEYGHEAMAEPIEVPS